jgi:hypothetical protein
MNRLITSLKGIISFIFLQDKRFNVCCSNQTTYLSFPGYSFLPGNQSLVSKFQLI